MHTYQTNSACFLFHGDLSGEVIILPLKNGETIRQSNGEALEIVIESEDILKFVAYNYVLDNAIGTLESMDYKDLLNILKEKNRTDS